jgi:hypothetical protein
LAFDKWWDDDPLIINNGERLTRKRAVLAHANVDGGASHIRAAVRQIAHELCGTIRERLHNLLS